MKRVFYEGRPSSDGRLYWFQDNKTPCEKQTLYFERMRQLDSELITKEKKHLVNAMERLKQLRCPRRKPVVLSNEGKKKYGQNSGRSFDDRKDRIQGTKSALSLNAKKMIISVEKDRANLKHERSNASREASKNSAGVASNERMEKHRMQLDCTAQSLTNTRSKLVPVLDVIFPSLPCIPNVGHKTNIEIENKLRILELANGEFESCTLFAAQSNVPSRGRRRNYLRLGQLNTSRSTDVVAPEDRTEETTCEKELSQSVGDGCDKQQEIAKSEKERRLKSDNDTDYGMSHAKQAPPPTRVNSFKENPQSRSTKNPLRVTIKNFNK